MSPDEARSFFVDSQGNSTTSVATTPALGYVERTCDVCGRTWGPTRCSSGGCSSMAFTDRYIEPVPLMTRIQEKLAPKPKAPRASAALVARVRDYLTLAERVRTELPPLKEAVQRAVRDGVTELEPVLAVLQEATCTTGDASPEHLRLCDLGNRALSDGLSGALQHIKETP